MSIKVMDWVWDHAEASGTELLLLLAIADNANDQGEAWPGVPTLTQKIRVTTDRDTQIVLRKLEAAGQLMIDPPRRGRKTNTYWIPFTEALQNKVIRRSGEVKERTDRRKEEAKKRLEERRRVKAFSPIKDESLFTSGVNPDSGVKGESQFTPGMTPDSPEPSFNHHFFEPSENQSLVDYDMPWGIYLILPSPRTPLPQGARGEEQGQKPFDGEEKENSETSPVELAGVANPPLVQKQKPFEGTPSPSLPRFAGQGEEQGQKLVAPLDTPCSWGTVRDAWKVAANQMALQFDQGIFETYIRQAELVGFEVKDTTFVFQAGNSHQRDFCQYRLNRNIARVLSDVYGQPVNLRFECAG
jgi:hypothetical protein